MLIAEVSAHSLLFFATYHTRFDVENLKNAKVGRNFASA